MIVCSITFPHKNIHKQTWVSSSGHTGNQIDHVIVEKRIRKWITDVRSMRGSSAISDHFLVKINIKIRLSVERQKKTALPKRISTEALKNQSVKEQYKRKLTEVLQSIQETNNLDEM